MRRRQALSILTAVTLSALTTSWPARAVDAEVTSDTDGQFYDVRSPTGLVVDQRRRTAVPRRRRLRFPLGFGVGFGVVTAILRGARGLGIEIGVLRVGRHVGRY